MDASRSTIYRALDELQARELVYRDDGEYHPTPFGVLVYQEYQRCVDTVRALQELRTSVGTLPPAKLFDPVMLVDAEIGAATEENPGQPLWCLKALLEKASSVRFTTPTHSWQVLGILDDQLHAGMFAELILDESNVESRTKEVLAHGRCETTHRTTKPPFVLAIVDEPALEVGVVILDDVGRPEATICNDTRAAFGWAESVYRACTTDE